MATPNFADKTIWTGDNLDIMRGMNSEKVAMRLNNLQSELGLEPDEAVVHVANQSTGHLIPLCVILTFPAAMLAFVGVVIPWIWYFLVSASHQGRFVVTDQRVFVLDCPGSDNRWYALRHIVAAHCRC